MRNSFIFIILCTGIVFLLWGKGKQEKMDQVPQVYGERTYKETESFGYGLDYARQRGFMDIENPAELYVQTGANWVKMPFVLWNLVQPTEEGDYAWERIDAVVADYQAYGFDMLLEIISNARWAVEVPQRGVSVTGSFTATPPKDGYWDDYARFVAAVVERYDGDGVDDMPGLRRAITHIEIESEAQHDGYWQVPTGKNRTEEYGKLLKTAYEAAHRANPQVQIFLSGINLGDVFDAGENYSYEELREFLDAVFSGARATDAGARAFWFGNIDFIVKTLAMNDYYDAVEFHYNHNYRAAGPTVNFIRGIMGKYGEVKPIWAGDALIAPAHAVNVDVATHPKTAGLGKLFFEALDDPQNLYHEKAWRWHMQEQSSNLVKKIVCALESGLAGIMAANEADWLSWSGNNAMWKYGGFYGASVDGVPLFARGKRPVFYMYAFLTEFLGVEARILERVDVGDDAAYVFRIVNGEGEEMLVAWYEDVAAEQRVQVVESLDGFFEIVKGGKDFDLSTYVSSADVLLIHTIVTQGEEEPRRERAHAARVHLEETPIFIRASLGAN